MSRKRLLILLFVALGALVAFAALGQWVTSGVVPKGSDPSSIAQYLALATSVVSLLTAIIGLLMSTRK